MNEEAQKLVDAGKLSAADAAALSKLEPGTHVLHKSWGVGRVAEWDLLGDRLLIDFEDKPGHGLKLGFAITSLTPLPEDHLMARRFAETEVMQEMAKKDPVALVELALKSAGGQMLLDDLETMVKGALVPEGSYKKWWESAKRQLKPVKHIVVPSKRTDPMVLVADDQKASDLLVNGFLDAHGLKAKVLALKAIDKDLGMFDAPAEELKPVFQDLSDTVRRAWRLHLKEALQLLLARDEMIEANELGEAPMGSMKVADMISEAREQLSEAVKSLPVGLVGRVYRSFPEAFPNREWINEALAHFTQTGGKGVGEIAMLLADQGEVEVLGDFLKKAVRNRQVSADLLIWICRKRQEASAAVFDLDLGHAILDALQADHMEGGPKRTGRLMSAFVDDKEMLGEMAAPADEHELRLFAKRLIAGSMFDELTRRSLMARIIKARPEVGDLMAGSEAGKKKEEALIVSWDSMERRKKELEEIVSVKIPQNKKDIQIAREYGDLRENFEYKSAKQQQAVLQRQQGELERDLNRAQGTDFAGVSTETVGIGTIVEVADAGSDEVETFTILGAWDGDVEKNIISYLSETAKALIGQPAGAEVTLPSDSEHGTRQAKIQSIRAFNAG
ncbi:MAG: GreA/GreB family elongation factor [Verrucomicrobiales bacterium]|nr:GreA/GreB family elongation factor [Verrucomicrobiales bacterium]